MFIINTIYAVIICLLFLGLMGSLFGYAYKLAFGNVNLLFNDARRRGIFLAIVIFTFFFCLYIIRQNEFIYYWDYGGYWTISYSIMQKIFVHPGSTIKYIYHSIQYADYNALIPLFLVLPLKIFGYTFTHYVLLNFLLFLVPVWYILSAIFRKIISSDDENIRFNKKSFFIFTSLLLLIVTFNPFYMAMFYGYADVICMIPAALAILLFYDYDPLSISKDQIKRDLLISILLLLTFLFRRYFAYFIVGYGTALTIYSIYKVIDIGREYNIRKATLHAFLNLSIIAISALLILIIFFRPLLSHVLLNNYAGQYSAYDAPLVDKVSQVISKFGWFTFILSGIAISFSLMRRKFRKITLFCAIATLVTVGAFFHVQSMGIHHIYTIALELIILMFLGVIQLVDSITTYKDRVGLIFGISTLLCLGFINCFIPVSREYLRPVSILFSQTYTPLHRNDISELHHLADYLNTLTQGNEKKIYIAASGGILNSSLMVALDKPYHENAVHNMYKTHDVDLRDGFPTQFLQSDYVVVSDPIQLHLTPGSQEVVRFLAQEVMNPKSPVGRHFEKLDKEFDLDNGVKAYIYMKTSEFDEADLQYLVNYYSQRYPGMDKLFKDRILALKG